MMERPDRCQGCGTPQGACRVTYKRRTGRRIVGKPVNLTMINLADYGTRWVCASCRAMAQKLNADLAINHLTLAG